MRKLNEKHGDKRIQVLDKFTKYQVELQIIERSFKKLYHPKINLKKIFLKTFFKTDHAILPKDSNKNVFIHTDTNNKNLKRFLASNHGTQKLPAWPQ